MTTLNTIIEEEKKEFDDRFDFQTKQYAEAGYVEAQNESTVEQLKAFLTAAMQRAYEAGKASDTQENTPDTEWEEAKDEFNKKWNEGKFHWNENDYDEDGNNIVPCPICLSNSCPSKKDGKCPDEDMFALEGEIRLLLTEYKNTDDNSRIANVLEAVESLIFSRDTYWKERVRKEAYLWFNTWYDKTISNKREERDEPFGKWATERLQELGEVEKLTNEDNLK